MSRIWFICPFATPTAYGWRSRPYIVGRELVNRGYEVHIFSFTGNQYLRSGNYKKIREHSWEKHEGVWFYWLKGIKKHKTNAFIRIYNWLYFNLQFLNYLRNNKLENPQAVVFSSPPITLAYLITPVKRILNPEVIFEVRDLWPLSMIELGNFASNNPFMLWLKKLEQKAYFNADQIIGVIPGMKDYLAQTSKFKPLEPKAQNIPQGYTEEEIPDLPESALEYDIGFAGTLSKANDLETLLDALKILAGKSIYPKVVIIGKGVNQEKVVQKATQLANVKYIKDWLPRNKVLNYLSKCRICYGGFKNLSIYDYGISCLKWMDYWMVKKPILTSYSGNLYDINIAEFGWQVPAGNPELLAEKINQILKTNNNELTKLGEKGYQHLRQVHHMSKVGDQYESIINA